MISGLNFILFENFVRILENFFTRNSVRVKIRYANLYASFKEHLQNKLALLSVLAFQSAFSTLLAYSAAHGFFAKSRGVENAEKQSVPSAGF